MPINQSVQGLLDLATEVHRKVSESIVTGDPKPRIEARKLILNGAKPLVDASATACPTAAEQVLEIADALDKVVHDKDGAERLRKAWLALKAAAYKVPAILQSDTVLIAPTPKRAANKRQTPKVGTSARIMDAYKKDPEKLNWSAQKWATFLGVGKSTVAETSAWEGLKLVKADAALQKAKRPDRRRK